MDYQEKEILQRELRENESILWYGKPIPKMFTGGGIVASIFGVIFICFSLFWVSTAWKMTSDEFFPPSLMDRIFPFFGFIFTIVGILLFLSPVWIKLDAKKTIYAITDKRCIIIKSGRVIKVKSYDKENINNYSKNEYRDGSGDIIFAKETYTTTDSDSRDTRLRVREIGFFNIMNVVDVEKFFREGMELN